MHENQMVRQGDQPDLHQAGKWERMRRFLRAFGSLEWYEALITFLFTFVTKTSELLLAAGIVVSTANFLTDGDVMNHHKVLSDAWSWAQALAIDSSLGIVFVNGFQAVRERDRVKAIIFFLLSMLLAVVAGLITHFDALAHAAGLAVTDKGVSGVIPLWVMTSLRAVAVIGFLLASRLKEFSFNDLLQTDPDRGDVVPVSPQRGTVPVRGEDLDVDALVAALVHALRQSEQTVPLVRVIEQEELATLSVFLQDPKLHQELMSRTGTSEARTGNQVPDQQAEIEERTDPLGSQTNPVNQADPVSEAVEVPTNKEEEPGPTKLAETSAQKGPVEERLQAAYAQLGQQGTKITVEALRQTAACKKTVASEWLSRKRQQ